MAEHTPTPWHSEVLIAGSDQLVIVADDKTLNGSTVIATRICGPDAEANAAFIVKAVNNHDALVKALRNARNYIDSVIVNSPDKKKRRNFGECLRIIEAALEPVGGPSFDAPQPRADVGQVGSSGK